MRPSLHLLFAAAATALIACGGGSESPAPSPPTSAPSPQRTPEPSPSPVPEGSPAIAGIDFAQSMVFASSDPELVLAGNRATLIKVNVVAPTPLAAKPSGVVRVEDGSGALLGELALDAPTGDLPTATPTRPSFDDSYSTIIPAAWVRAGMRVTPQFTPSAANEMTVTPRVGGSVELRVVMVPVQIGGAVGQVVSEAEGYLSARLPAAQITQGSHAPMVSTQVTTLPTTSSEWDSAFSRILGEIDDLHLLENAGSRTLYFGFIPKRSSGIAGMGYRPGNAAVGFDLPSSPNSVRETMTHEIGHNLSLRHAPCGSATNPDPNYPYANAAMGAGNRFIWGYDASSNGFIDPRPTSVHDVMSYCDGDWFSDYNYRLMQVYLTPSDRTLSAVTASQELLLISGDVDAQGLHLNPLKSTVGTGRVPDDGPYLLRITTAAGAVIEQRFASREIDHRADRQHFGFTIAHPGPIERVEVLHGGRVMHQRVARARKPSADPTPGVQVSEQGGAVTVRWDSARQPYLTVTHLGATRTAITLDAQGGAVTLPTGGLPAGGRFELGLSDGVNVERVLVRR
ncbi:MAG TPA: M66 family metalloprotease [Burkholderiaceae bacterium]|nr:M66 family metalloprotease [Burkholderiaceae bacterium]